MSTELRDRINDGAETAREAIRKVIEIHGLGSVSEEVKYLKSLDFLASSLLYMCF